MVTRRFNVFDPVVLTVGMVRAGTRSNIIPDTAHFEASVRRFSEVNEEQLKDAIHETPHGVAPAHGFDVEVEYDDGYPLTVDDTAEAEFAARVAEDLFGPGSYENLTDPMIQSEDFSLVLAEVPGAMVFLGATPDGADPTRHRRLTIHAQSSTKTPWRMEPPSSPPSHSTGSTP
jgi:metal-dependent amidase/aminoacylase/carboxypeptidase family protein